MENKKNIHKTPLFTESRGAEQSAENDVNTVFCTLEKVQKEFTNKQIDMLDAKLKQIEDELTAFIDSCR
ncbi:hypothetical protein [Treponema phagedenis]|uniref:hypothetical protein n=1 Tax=Treponema phagedenis TaxID=162 RepID=UPI0001F63EAC|nr:hypothetical protein [Treponema phagedenis]EFW37857.1 hypothetical protein HMPREF9554_01641 [Treponema phagedenis F0421]TYT79684.1 hypothetical protein FS559_11715 [Treponema phagedenis]